MFVDFSSILPFWVHHQKELNCPWTGTRICGKKAVNVWCYDYLLFSFMPQSISPLHCVFCPDTSYLCACTQGMWNSSSKQQLDGCSCSCQVCQPPDRRALQSTHELYHECQASKNSNARVRFHHLLMVSSVRLLLFLKVSFGDQFFSPLPVTQLYSRPTYANFTYKQSVGRVS